MEIKVYAEIKSVRDGSDQDEEKHPPLSREGY